MNVLATYISIPIQKSQGTLEGQITLIATSVIGGSEQSFKLSSYDRTTNAYFHIEGEYVKPQLLYKGHLVLPQLANFE